MATVLRPVNVFAIHIPPLHQARLVAEVHEFDPGAVPLLAPMSRHNLQVL
jgi:hypothetical protein